MTDEQFFEDLIAQIPELKTEILTWETDMIFFRMEAFAEYTNKQIGANNFPLIERCFDFIESKIDSMSSNLLNALNVSYCEALLLGKYESIMEKITEKMPPKLLSIYLDYKQYYIDLGSKANKM